MILEIGEREEEGGEEKFRKGKRNTTQIEEREAKRKER